MYDIHAGVSAGMREKGLDDPEGPGIAVEPGAPSGSASGIGAGSLPDPGSASLEPRSGSSIPSAPASAGVVRSPPAGPDLVPLPRQTAALHDDYLGRDRMGPKLITRPRTDISHPGRPGRPDQPGHPDLTGG
jgi:hypothetical protein